MRLIHLQHWKLMLVTLTVGAGMASISSAQSTPYLAPGTVQETSPNPRESLDTAIENARWKFGALRIDPWIGVDRLGYVSNTLGQLTATGDDRDYLAVASGGFQGYLPIGGKSFFTFHARPQYSWWRDQSERSGFNEVFGGSLFGLYNRLQIELSVDRTEHLGVITRELEQELVQRTENAKVDSVLNIYRRFDLVAGSRNTKFESVDRSAAVRSNFAELDREETVSRLGLRFSPGQAQVSLGAQQSQVRFSDASHNRANSGTSLFASAMIMGSRSRLSAEVIDLDLKPDFDADSVGTVSESTGGIEAGFTSRSERLDTTVYFRRRLSYTLDNLNSHFIAASNGIRLRLITGRSAWSAFFEAGSDDYRGSAPRSDDRTAYGVDYSLPLGDKAEFSAGFSHSELDSTDKSATAPENPNIDRFRLGITFTPFGTAGGSPSIRGSGL